MSRLRRANRVLSESYYEDGVLDEDGGYVRVWSWSY